VTLGQSAHDKLRYAQALLGHAVGPGAVADLLERALDALIAQEEKRKFAVGTRTRKRTSKGEGRYIPAETRRAVFLRDGGKCTFVGDHGHRCESDDRIQFDHVIPEARGGRTTEDNLRLRCRAHNQYEADRVFGARFMQGRRDRARPAAAKPRAARPA
jgi:5-methylcytosine-specific restriction endonuclease McrA